jgi:MFS family permease
MCVLAFFVCFPAGALNGKGEHMRRSLTYYFTSEIFLSFGIGMSNYGQPFLYQSGYLSGAQIGILFALNAAVGGLFALILGPVADRVGASRVFKLATLLMGLGALWTGLAHSFSGWLAASAFTGLATGLLMSTENVVLSSLTKSREKAGILSKFVSLYTLLIALGTVTAGFLISATSYRRVVLIGAYLILVAPIIRHFVVAPDAKSPGMFRLPSRKILMMSVYAVIFGTAIGLFRRFNTLVLSGHFGLNDKVTSSVAAIMLFMISLGSLLVSPMLRRLRHGRTLLMAFTAGTLFTLVMAMTGSAWVFVTAMLLRTILVSVPQPIVDSMFLDITPETEYAQMFGVRVFGNSIGNAIGAYGGGLFLDAGSVMGMLTVSATLLMASCLYLFWLLHRVTTHVLLPMRRPDDRKKMQL